MTVTRSAPPETRLRPPRHRVQRRAVAWWSARILLVAAPLAGAPALAALLLPAVAPVPAALVSALWTAAAALGAAGLAVTAVVPQWRYRVHRWEVTDTAVYTASGWFWQEWRVAPMSRVQTVDTSRGPLQRLFRLAGVTVTTASAAGPIAIEGLDGARADRVAAELTEAAHNAEGDAT
ncbi:PH domain-containing protein [Streptomonospora wellingtoniae]|uniref:PH domain-containing protein n=1 Tax=Streptomonospora wellingtoniae TaxID=3075544 RepID=A0ABU2KTQ3_9ACTN|nr:PH domain-containing protein [Streptomonospora sp. DSM 45055]MDT0302675.1 PH domain-containing protein [Streptomonospora sp. DSM 45055]